MEFRRVDLVALGEAGDRLDGQGLELDALDRCDGCELSENDTQWVRPVEGVIAIRRDDERRNARDATCE